jgi:hypothetical protein
MEGNFIKLKGIVEFDPIDRTKKHERQSVWKKTAVVNISGNICSYYCWFIKKRYNLHLQTPFRNAHITFVSDRKSDINGKWEEVKEKWNGVEVEVILDVDVRSDGKSWWLNITNEYKNELNIIRKDLNLSSPFFPFHMTVGTAVDSRERNEKGLNVQSAVRMSEEHSKYIVNLIRNGYSY